MDKAIVFMFLVLAILGAMALWPSRKEKNVK